MKEEWLFPNAVVPVDAQTTAALVDEIKRLIGVVGNMALKVADEREACAALVAAAEREKSLQLWMLLDDIDTADDIAKTDEAIYRSLCRQAHAKRWSLLNGDEVDAAIRARGSA